MPNEETREGVGTPSPTPPAIPTQSVPFDYVNTLVLHEPTPEHIQVVVLVPLVDGSASETKLTLRTPNRVVHEDGTAEYRMVIDQSFSVTPTQREPSGRVRMETRDGLTWEIPEDYPGAWTALLDHEPSVREFLLPRFREGGVFVDVGANVGAYSLRAASRGMEVHSFEPVPQNVQVLRRNSEINNLTLDIEEVALGSSEGTTRLAPSGASSRITKAGGIEVPLRTLDSFNLPRLDLLKVDVEGYELEVLRGAGDTLARCHPAMMVEMHHWVGAESEAAIFEMLSRLGYRFEYLDRYAFGRHLSAMWTPKTS
jgi:FkbM family methyltransferase